ncbi:MAG: OLD family protein [Ferrimicrobium acidiphilum]
MRIARIEITRFRGFESFVLVPREHVVVVGEPRAGRSDLIAALRKVLEPRSTMSRPSEWDVFRPLPAPLPPGGDEEDEVTAPLTSIEISILELADETEQALQDRLELLSPTTGEPADKDENDDAKLGVRLRYCLQYNPDEEQLQHWIEYPKSGARVHRSERELLRAFVLDRNQPLQLRAEGALRHLANDPDPDAMSETLQEFAKNIAAATQTLAESDEVQAALNLITQHGARRLLELDPTDPTAAIGFTAEDGSLAALLRAVQPTLDLDMAGVLPLSAHGSTTAAILAAAEASAAAQASDAIVIADDFGDHLDAASGEYLAARVRRRAGQLWLATRQPEVPRAFEATELLRLTRSTGSRQAYQLSETPDRKERIRRRHLFTILGPAMSARTVVLLEGPHDMETYTTVSRRQFREEGKVPLSALGMRLVPASAGGSEGGKSELPKIAKLATELGLAVRIVLDHDKPGTDKDLIDELCEIAEMVVRLPERAAVERAIVDGLSSDELRQALDSINDDHDLKLDIDSIDNNDLADKSVWALKQKGGLHRPFIDALPAGTTPPLAAAVLKQIKASAPAIPLITLDAP